MTNKLINQNALEEEYFHRREAELIEKLKADKSKLKVKGETESYLCPKCHYVMRQISFSDIPVERCANCNGIFFDSGEVETLIKRKTQRTLWNIFKEAL